MHFLVRTDAFESRQAESEFINERCFGEDFGIWLHQRLCSHGTTASEPIQEDWGWCILVTFEDDRFVVSIGLMDDSIGALPADWIVGVVYDGAGSRLRHLFRKPAEPITLAQVCSVIDAILANDSRLHIVERESG